MTTMDHGLKTRYQFQFQLGLWSFNFGSSDDIRSFTPSFKDLAKKIKKNDTEKKKK